VRGGLARARLASEKTFRMRDEAYADARVLLVRVRAATVIGRT
jgi:hypothetical protein